MTAKYRSTFWIGAFFLSSMVLSSSSASAADWSDDFTGSITDNGWIFSDGVGPPANTTVDIHPSEFLQMVNSSGTPDLSVVGFVPEVFNNVAATATVAASRNPPSNNDVFLSVRSSGSDGYLLNVDYDSGMAELAVINSGVPGFLGASSIAPIDSFGIEEEYTLQLAALNDFLFGQVRDSTGVVRAIVSATDNSYSSGVTGVGAAINLSASSQTPIGAGFDNVASVEVVAGSSPTSAILPDTSSAPWNFSGVPGGGNWFDPAPATGYVYETDGLSSFTAVMLPVGYDDDNMFTIDDGGGPVAVSGGSLYVFPSPVMSFEVGGIYVPVDGDDPLAFPTFLSFDELVVSFTQTPVPEPSSLLLFSLAALGMASMPRRRSRQ